MDSADAARLHAALAHALMVPWQSCTELRLVLQRELTGWSSRRVESDEEFFEQILGQFENYGVESEAIHALACIEPAYERLNQTFSRLVKLVRHRYDAAAKWDRPKVVELVREYYVVPIYPDPPPLGMLGAAACVPPRNPDDDSPAVVKLKLIPGLLGPPSWAAIPYLLCHELVCHVNQAAPMSSGDPFGEGWMDLIAERLHNRWTKTLFPWAPEFARESADELSRIIRQLTEKLQEPHMTTRGARRTGRLAAEAMERGVLPQAARHCGVACKPSVALERLSLQLNQTPATVADRRTFVTNVTSCFYGHENSRRDLRTRRLREAAAAWMTGAEPASRVLFFT